MEYSIESLLAVGQEGLKSQHRLLPFFQDEDNLPLKGRDPLMCAPSMPPPLPAPVPSLDVDTARFSGTEELLRLASEQLGKRHSLQGIGSALKRSVEEAFGSDAENEGCDTTVASLAGHDVYCPTAGNDTLNCVESESRPLGAGATVKDEQMAAVGIDKLPAAAAEGDSDAAGAPRRSKRVASGAGIRQSSRARQVPRRLIDTYAVGDGGEGGVAKEDTEAESEREEEEEEEEEVVDKVGSQPAS